MIPEKKSSWDWRQIRLGLIASGVVYLIALISVKPYLLTAVRYGFQDLDDYKIFAKREIAPDPLAQEWPVSGAPVAPPQELSFLLKSLKTTALLAIKNGEIIHESYDLGGGAQVLSNSFSMAKTVVALMVGVAIDQGKMRLDDPIERFIFEWSDRPEGKITVRAFLAMSSGLNWNESYNNPFAITCEAYYGKNLLKTLLKQRLWPKNSGIHHYSSGDTGVLGVAVARALGVDFSKAVETFLWTKIGARKSAVWSLDHEAGIEKTFCCLSATARDFARLGTLFLPGGPQVVSAHFLNSMMTPNGLMDEKGKRVDYYGWQMWINRVDGRSVPYLRGSLGQYVFIVPETQVIVVRLGHRRGESVDHHESRVDIDALTRWAISL